MARFTLKIDGFTCQCGTVTPDQVVTGEIADDDAARLQALEQEGRVSLEISEGGKRATWVDTQKDAVITTAVFDSPIRAHHEKEATPN
jgi:hypothetical protein